MASAELAVVRDEPAAVAHRDIVDGWVAMASSVFKLAEYICDTEFVPKNYRGNAPATAAAILTGRELNMGPMMSLKHVQVVEGNPSLSAEYKRARILGAGHEFAILEWTNTLCRVKGRRRGSGEPPLEITYTMDDAKRAGLIRDRSGWIKRPRRMLFARAGTDLADALFADVTNGLPTAELLAEGTDADDEFAGYNEADSQEPPKPAGRTARRKTAAGGRKGEDDQGGEDRGMGADRVKPSGSQRTDPPRPEAPGPASSLPPLPGEDEDSAPAVPDEQAPSGPAAGAEQEPAPGSDRHRKLVGVVRAHFKRLGYTDADDEVRLEHTAVLASTSGLGSTNDLDEDELKAVADTLARCRDVDALRALLDAAANQDGDSDA